METYQKLYNKNGVPCGLAESHKNMTKFNINEWVGETGVFAFIGTGIYANYNNPVCKIEKIKEDADSFLFRCTYYAEEEEDEMKEIVYEPMTGVEIYLNQQVYAEEFEAFLDNTLHELFLNKTGTISQFTITYECVNATVSEAPQHVDYCVIVPE